MAATSQERGIKHIKDVFSQPPAQKSNSMTFLARKPLAPAPPSRNSAQAAAEKQNGVGPKTNTAPKVPENKNNGVVKSNTVERNESKSNGNINNQGKGGAFLRAEKDKNINTMQLPVPVTLQRNQNNNSANNKPQLNGLNKAKSGKEEIYLSPSPVSSPTSPGYTKQFPSPTSPGYSSKIAPNSPSSPTSMTSPKSPGYTKVTQNSDSGTAKKYSAPPPPKSLPFTRAVVELQPMQSPDYDREISGFDDSPKRSNGYGSPPMSPGYTRQTPEVNGHVYAHHVDVHRPADFAPPTSAGSASPVYERKLDFLNHPAPKSPDNDVGSLFNGDDTQDMPYTPPSLNSPAAITTLDKKNNNTSSLFKKKSDAKHEKGGRFGNKKRHSGDETISSLAPSSGYHSEFDSEISSPSSPKSPVSRTGTKITEDDSAFDEEECTFDFTDDDGMYNGSGRQYPVSSVTLCSLIIYGGLFLNSESITCMLKLNVLV